MRDVFCKALVQAAGNPDFVFLTGDLGYRALEPLREALGKRFKTGGPNSPVPWATIVGIVADVRQMGTDAPVKAEMYFPYRQIPGNAFSPRDLVISPSLGSTRPAMQRSNVDLPRPLAATSPMRSPALMERSSRENSGAFSVTPRLRILIRVMIVPWSCRPTRRPGHAAIIGCSCWSAASY